MTDESSALLSLLRARRSIRRFRTDPVPEEMITRLVEAATWAPSAGNRQAWRLVVVRTPECIATMADVVREEVARMRQHLRSQGLDANTYFGNLHHFEGAPVVLAPFHRVGVSLSEAIHAGRIPPPPIEAETVASVAAAIQNLLLCAHALGLGACWMTGPLVAAEALAPVLGIPAGWTLSALVPVGFPAETPPPPPRRPLAQIVRMK